MDTKKPGMNPPILGPTGGLSRGSNDRGLKYRWRAKWMASIYLPLLVVPWVLTAVMMYRPIMLPSYINQVGQYTMTDIDHHQRWFVTADVLNRIASVLGVPVVSAILAQGAVVFAQRRKPGQELNIKQLFALADRGWIDPPVLWDALLVTQDSIPRRPVTRSKYLWLGAFLVLITAIRPPLQSLLVPDDYVVVPTCNDGPVTKVMGKGCFGIAGRVGRDSEPPQMEYCPQDLLVQRVLGNILNVRPDDVQDNLWLERGGVWEDTDSPFTNTFGWIYRLMFSLTGNDEKSREKYFVSPILNGTTTGVLRQHAARMESGATCVPDTNFPDDCPGDRPFSTRFRSEFVEASICAEGSFNKLPWTRSRDKQEITERLWLDLKVLPSYHTGLYQYENFTMRCDATSTRGWFELGNYQNGFVNQPIRERWPSPEEMETEFNDYGSTADYPVRVEPPADLRDISWNRPPDPFGTRGHVAAGPLMSAALALFGNTTFFYTAREAPRNRHFDTAATICYGNRLPFLMYVEEGDDLERACLVIDEEDEDDQMLSSIVRAFMGLFEKPVHAKELLEVVMYFANDALLTLSTGGNLRTIFTSPGTQIPKPHKSLAGLIAISIVVALQVLGLGFLLFFIYSTPAWTAYLDADALVQIGAQLREQDDDVVRGTSNGLIGVVESGPTETSSLTETETEAKAGAEEPSLGRKKETVLALGASGLITKRSHKA